MNILRDWRWWRHNHGCTYWKAVKLTFITAIWGPLDNIYSWFWLQTIGRINAMRCRRMMAEMKQMQKKNKAT